MDINAHFVRKISATAHHSRGTHWIELTIDERSRAGTTSSSKIVLFTEGDEAAAIADAYATAINVVNKPATEPAPA